MLGLAALTPLACQEPGIHPNPARPEDDGADASSDDSPAAAGASTSEAEPAAEPVVLVTDPEVLVALEQGGLGAGAVAFGSGDASVASFADTPGFAAIRKTLARDIAEQRRADPKAGVGMKHNHRLFDLDWLGPLGDKTRFELTAVVNRADREPFAPAHCGETRLIYRLAYTSTIEGETVDSRLPMTLNVVLWQDGDDCGAVARRWMAPAGLEPAALASWLRRDEGPLAPARVARSQLEAVEVNLQLVRWPAVMHPSLGGHAAYLLRVFRPDGDALAPAPLENTPDVERLRRDDDEREALLAWLRAPETLAALELGTAVMPERFAATRAISVAPRGLGRVANRPFSQLFEATELRGLGLEDRPTLHTGRGLLRRLDGLSCNGCHETRSVAGFHLLGEPRDDGILDKMFVPTSPHLDGDLERRAAWVRAVASGEPGDEARPLSDHERNLGGYGSHCGLGDPAFAAWTCDPGLTCVALDDEDMGECLTTLRGAGDPCEIGELRSKTEPTRDRVRDVEVLTCEGEATCNTTRVGFPGGMCTKSCQGLHRDEACGAIVNLSRFNNCLAKQRPFPACIEAAAFEAGMRRCDADHRCRDDYICARSPADPDSGVCIPPYFLFQMRVDGHVLR
jgi:hypothetical protein